MATSKNGPTIGLLLLAGTMLATRLHHFEYLPDASWAIFFLSGFYLFDARAFAVLMVEAMLIDYVATAHLGVSSYCLSIAYPFVLPADATLWLGGRLAARHWYDELSHRSGWLVVCLLVSVSACFLLTNGSFSTSRNSTTTSFHRRWRFGSGVRRICLSLPQVSGYP
jgi:hypothetical protein